MKRFALLPALVLACSTSLAGQPETLAQNPGVPPIVPPVFRSGASMVALNVTVLEGRKLVNGLGRGDFEVYEDGVQQQVHFFESRGVPMDLILLLDTSASMNDKMDVVHEAARGFMKMLGPGDRGAVVAFSESVKVIQPLSSDPAAIQAAIAATKAGGGTALHNAIYVVLKEFGVQAQTAGEVRRQAIAVLSDGEDTSSLVSFDDVMAQARKSGVSIYTIGLKSRVAPLGANVENRRHFSESDYALKSLARETGAQAFFPETLRELKGVYDAIASELSSQYSIGYSPANARADGRFRRIVVRLMNKPAFTSRARAGYTADAPARVASAPAPR